MDRVPEYPLRCQHCTASIKLYAVAAGEEHAFVDPNRSVVCNPMANDLIFHRPMPSVLG